MIHTLLIHHTYFLRIKRDPLLCGNVGLISNFLVHHVHELDVFFLFSEWFPCRNIDNGREVHACAIVSTL